MGGGEFVLKKGEEDLCWEGRLVGRFCSWEREKVFVLGGAKICSRRGECED